MPEEKPPIQLEDVPTTIRGRIRELRDRLEADGIKVWTDEDDIHVGLIWDRDAIVQTGKTGEYKSSSVIAQNTEEAPALVDRVGDLNRVNVKNVHVTLESIRINASLSFKA